MSHGFIFSSGIWIGEGKITFSTSSEFIKFYTKWEIIPESETLIRATQKVEMQGIKEHVINYFIFKDITPTSFSVLLESEAMGSVHGNGVINSTVLAWEIRSNPSNEGFEVYELQDNGDYSLHAEYASTDQYRTIVDGLIWKKGS